MRRWRAPWWLGLLLRAVGGVLVITAVLSRFGFKPALTWVSEVALTDTTGVVAAVSGFWVAWCVVLASVKRSDRKAKKIRDSLKRIETVLKAQSGDVAEQFRVTNTGVALLVQPVRALSDKVLSNDDVFPGTLRPDEITAHVAERCASRGGRRGG